MKLLIQYLVFFFGINVFSYGIATAIQVQHLGIHPWDVLSIALFEKAGLSIGSWNIIVGMILVLFSFFLDRTYIKIGTFLNAIFVGVFVDMYLYLDFFISPGSLWVDMLILLIGIILMGIGGGVYSAAGLGAGPRDGFMLSISDKSNLSISKVRIITESAVLVIGLLLGGPVFIFTFIYTFLQSPIYQFAYHKTSKQVGRINTTSTHRKKAVS